MSVYDFLYLCVDERMLKITVYDLNTEQNVFSGDYDDIPDELMECEVMSFDCPYEPFCITLNIERECEEV